MNGLLYTIGNVPCRNINNKTEKYDNYSFILYRFGELGILTTDSTAKNFKLNRDSPRSISHMVKVNDISAEKFSILDFSSRKYVIVDKQNEKNHFKLSNEKYIYEKIKNLDEDAIIINKQLGEINFHNVYKFDVQELVLFLKSSSINWKSKRILASAVWGVLCPERMENFAKIMMQDKELRDVVKKIFNDDIWICRSIPILYDFVSSRNNSDFYPFRTYTSSRDEGDLARVQLGEKYNCISIGHHLASVCRSQISPRKKTCIVATARNEGPYIVEWVAYHRAVGFDDIIVYSNDNEDGSDEVLKALADEGLIYWINNNIKSGQRAQEKAYTHALSILPYTLDYEWSLFIDIDEFFVFNKDIFSDIGDFLDWHSSHGASAIACNWVYVGPSGHGKWGNDRLTRRMNKSAKSASGTIKTLFKPRFAASSHAHFPRSNRFTTFNFFSSDGSLHKYGKNELSISFKPAISDIPTNTHAFIYHYYMKSAEELIWKLSRNKGDHPAEYDSEYFDINPKYAEAFLKHFHFGGDDASANINKMAPSLDMDINKITSNTNIKSAVNNMNTKFMKRKKRVMELFRKKSGEIWGDYGKKIQEIIDI